MEIVLYDSSWTAGVDCESDDEDYDPDDEDFDSDEEDSDLEDDDSADCSSADSETDSEQDSTDSEEARDILYKDREDTVQDDEPQEEPQLLEPNQDQSDDEEELNEAGKTQTVTA